MSNRLRGYSMAHEPSEARGEVAKSRGWRFTDTQAREIAAAAKEAGLHINSYLWACHSSKKQVLDVAKILRQVRRLVEQQNESIDRKFAEFLANFEVPE